MASADDLVDSIARSIARYLIANREAADTIEGIRRWWLPPDQVDAPIETIRAALERLQAAGRVASTRMPDGRLVFSAASKRGGFAGPAGDRQTN